MISQANLRVSCKQGRLVVGDSHISLRGDSPWELERSEIAGVGCVAGLLMADLTVLTRDGQRLPLEGVSFREALTIIELLGYLAAPGHYERALPGGSQHLEIVCRYTRSKLVITPGSVGLTGTSSWTIARGTITSVSCASGEGTACVTIHTSEGRHLTVDGLPFNGAMHALDLLGVPSREVPAPDPAPKPPSMPDPTPEAIVPPADPSPEPSSPPSPVREPAPVLQPVRKPPPLPRPVNSREPAILFTSRRATTRVSDHAHPPTPALSRLSPASAPGSASMRVNAAPRPDGAGRRRPASARASTGASASTTLSKVDAFRASIRATSTPVSAPRETAPLKTRPAPASLERPEPITLAAASTSVTKNATSRSRVPASADAIASRVVAFQGAYRRSVIRLAARGARFFALVVALVTSLLTRFARWALALLLQCRRWCGALVRVLGGRSLALVASVRKRLAALVTTARTLAYRGNKRSWVSLLAFSVLVGLPFLLTGGGTGGAAVGNSAGRSAVRVVIPVRPDRRVPAVRAAHSSARAVAQARATRAGTDGVPPVQRVFVGSEAIRGPGLPAARPSDAYESP